jgi:predicted nucleotidyltransferase
MSNCESCVLETVADELRQLGPRLEEAEAVGLFGSILWPKFNEYSDLDVFVVLREEDFSEETMALWEKRIRPPLQRRFKRDVDVRFYTVRALKKVPDWYEILLASDHYLVYDKGQVAEVFRRIVAEAERVGLIRVWTERGYPLWKMGRPLRFGETITVEVRDDDEPCRN